MHIREVGRIKVSRKFAHLLYLGLKSTMNCSKHDMDPSSRIVPAPLPLP